MSVNVSCKVSDSIHNNQFYEIFVYNLLGKLMAIESCLYKH